MTIFLGHQNLKFWCPKFKSYFARQHNILANLKKKGFQNFLLSRKQFRSFTDKVLGKIKGKSLRGQQQVANTTEEEQETSRNSPSQMDFSVLLKRKSSIFAPFCFNSLVARATDQ